MANQSYIRQTVIRSPYGGEMAASQIEDQNEQQQKQPAYHSSDNAEIARSPTSLTRMLFNTTGNYYKNNQWCSVVLRVLDQRRLF